MPELTAEHLRELVTYDPETGVMRWRAPRSNRLKVGDKLGGRGGNGYLLAHVGGLKHYIHRLAWLYVHGAWPVGQVDHVNGDRGDNRISNLRLAAQPQQNANAARRSDNASGYRGVCWHPPTKSWRAYVTLHGRQKHLGYFSTRLEAAAAYRWAAEQHFGEFASHISRRSVNASPATLSEQSP